MSDGSRDDLHAQLRDELAERRPPLDDLVTTALNEGRHRRRNRRLATWLCASTAGVTVAAVVLGGQVVSGLDGDAPGVTPGSVASTSAAVPSTTTPAALESTIASRNAERTAAERAAKSAAARAEAQAQALAPQVARARESQQTQALRSVAATLTTEPTPPSPWATAAGARVPATSRAMLELLKALLPQATLSQAARPADIPLDVQVRIDDGQHAGVVEMSVSPAEPNSRARDLACQQNTATCATLADGDVVTIFSTPDACVSNSSVEVTRADGADVRIDIVGCLATGSAGHADARPLTLAQAVLIADNAAWGLTMDPSLVAAGDSDFPGLPVR